MASLLELCDIHSNKSTTFHPQSDRQTEHVNQTLEQYLRIFCDYQQDNWLDLLPLAEFSYNNAKHSSTQVSPFFANYGFHPRMSILNPAPQENANPTAEDLVQKLERIHNSLRCTLREAQLKYKEAFDAYIKESPPFRVGDLVWLSRKHIKTSRPSLKLDAKRLSTFRILEVVEEVKSVYKLELPPQMKVQP